MHKSLEQVKEFHEVFNCPVESVPTIKGTPLGDMALVEAEYALLTVRASLREFSKIDNRCQRVALIAEELAELARGLAEGSLTKSLDALADIQYVLDGTTLSIGLHGVIDDAVDLVHASNMSKVGPDGKPIYDEAGKVKKGPNYRPVDLSVLLPESK